jgi:hypothetical protein
MRFRQRHCPLGDLRSTESCFKEQLFPPQGASALEQVPSACADEFLPLPAAVLYCRGNLSRRTSWSGHFL